MSTANNTLTEALNEVNRVYEEANKGYEMDCLISAEFSTYPDEWIDEQVEQIRIKYGISKEEWERELFNYLNQ